MALGASFRAAHFCLLRDNGDVVGADAAPTDPRHSRLLVVSRGLTRFQRFTAPAGLSRSQLFQAARLFAEANAPFADADWALLQTSDGIGIWWWDAMRIRELLGSRWSYDPERIVPESVLQPPGDGWRQVATIDGYEAQLWRAGRLAASMWRRRQFSPDQWASFAHDTSDAADAPAVPPEPVAVGLLPIVGWSPMRDPVRWGWPRMTRYAAVVALCAATTAACYSGQAARLRSNATTELAAATAIEARTASDPATRRALAQLAGVQAFRERVSMATPLLAGAQALGVLDRLDLEASAWSVDRQRFQARLVAPGEDFSLQDLAARLEAHPALRDVAIRLDPDSLSILVSADLERAGTVAAADGAGSRQ